MSQPRVIGEQSLNLRIFKIMLAHGDVHRILARMLIGLCNFGHHHSIGWSLNCVTCKENMQG